MLTLSALSPQHPRAGEAAAGSLECLREAAQSQLQQHQVSLGPAGTRGGDGESTIPIHPRGLALLSRYLIKFLAKLTEYQDTNKMTPSNVAIVLGPNLLWPQADG